MAGVSSMRLVVVEGSPPDSSRSRLPMRRIAAQPPGPGLPLQAPSVNSSTSGLVLTARSQPVVRERGRAAVKAQFRHVLLRILALDQGVRRRVRPVIEARQQEAQGSATRQQRQYFPLLVIQPADLVVGLQQRACLGGVEGVVALEAPGIEADRDVIGQEVIAGEVEVDEARQLVMQEEDVVVEQVGVDDARRPALRPIRLEEVDLRPRLAIQLLVDMTAPAVEQRPPAGDRQCIWAREREVATGKMQPGERFADRTAMPDGNAAWREPMQERRDGRRPTREHTNGVAVAAVDGPGTVDAASR